MVSLDSLAFIAFVSLLTGMIPVSASGRLETLRRPVVLLLAVLKGTLAPGLAYLLIGTGISATMASLLTITGSRLSPVRKDPYDIRTASDLGAIGMISPSTGVIMLLAGLLIRRHITNGILRGALLLLILPVTLWAVKRTDLYIIYGIILVIVGTPEVLGFSRAFRPGLRRAAVSGITALVLASLGSLYVATKYVYRGFGFDDHLVRSGNPEMPFIALTFDDGPDPIYTPQILDVLKEMDIPATFFVVGQHAEKYPDLIRRMKDEGHEVGLHTYSHRNLVGLSKNIIEYEIFEAQKAVDGILGERTHLFRPPRGLYNQTVVELLKSADYTLVLWSVTSRDWTETGKNSITRNVTKHTGPGDIILFHDSGSLVSNNGGNRSNTVAALPGIIEELRSKGFEFVTVSDLILISGLTETRSENDQPEPIVQME